MTDRQVSMVTGASQGIGRAIALRLGADGAGVVLVARNSDNLERVAAEVAALGGRAAVVQGDVTSPADMARGVSTAFDTFGRLDAVVANSGVGGPSGVLWELELSDWHDTFEVNVHGVFLTIRAALPRLIEQGSGSVVVVGSISGKRPLYGRSAYTTTKAALIGLVRTLALEAGQHGIRVNLVSPGFVAGPRLDWVIDAQAQARGITSGDVKATFESESALGRLTQPEDVAAVVSYLTSDEAAAITGADINVNSGVVMY